jgi:hypothetical protein
MTHVDTLHLPLRAVKLATSGASFRLAGPNSPNSPNTWASLLHVTTPRSLRFAVVTFSGHFIDLRLSADLWTGLLGLFAASADSWNYSYRRPVWLLIRTNIKCFVFVGDIGISTWRVKVRRLLLQKVLMSVNFVYDAFYGTSCLELATLRKEISICSLRPAVQWLWYPSEGQKQNIVTFKWWRNDMRHYLMMTCPQICFR